MKAILNSRSSWAHFIAILFEEKNGEYFTIIRRRNRYYEIIFFDWMYQTYTQHEYIIPLLDKIFITMKSFITKDVFKVNVKTYWTIHISITFVSKELGTIVLIDDLWDFTWKYLGFAAIERWIHLLSLSGMLPLFHPRLFA